MMMNDDDSPVVAVSVVAAVLPVVCVCVATVVATVVPVVAGGTTTWHPIHRHSAVVFCINFVYAETKTHFLSSLKCAVIARVQFYIKESFSYSVLSSRRKLANARAAYFYRATSRLTPSNAAILG